MLVHACSNYTFVKERNLIYNMYSEACMLNEVLIITISLTHSTVDAVKQLTSNQARLPTEFKHINKWRKRNQQGYS